MCTDTPTDDMATNGRDCSWSFGLNNKCNRDASWVSARTCEYSCYMAGVGYFESSADHCCGSPPPTPPTPPPSPPSPPLPPAIPPQPCSLSVGSSPWRAANPNIWGFNQLNGVIYLSPFDQPSLNELPKALWSGNLRFPGGTVANYYYMPNATFALPCASDAHSDASGDEGVGGSHDKCSEYEDIAAWPQNTFSAANFMAGLGTASPVADPNGPVWVVNMLTVSVEDISSQIRWLKEQHDNGIPVKYIEVGNEIFIKSHYEAFIPDASAFIDRIRPAMLLAKQLLPDAKLAVPYAYRFCGPAAASMAPWNQVLAANADLFDALTIHEYSACIKSVDNSGSYDSDPDQIYSALLAWGESALIKDAVDVASFFSPADVARLDIWVTEWGTAAWSGTPLQSRNISADAFRQTGVAGIFLASYLLSAAAPRSEAYGRTTGMNLQVLN